MKCRILLLLLLLVRGSLASICSVCGDGLTTVPLPDKALGVAGIPVEDCGTLATTVAFLPSDSDFCAAVRDVSTLCGCPVPEDACRLCGESPVSVEYALVELAEYRAPDFFAIAVPDESLTCETLQAVLHAMPANDARCTAIRRNVSQTCGCPNIPPPPPDNTQLPVPTQPPAPTFAPKEPCSFCANGGTITEPDKPVKLGDIPVQNCQDLNDFAVLLTQGAEECLGIQTLGYYCGCPLPENVCTFCPNGEPVPLPDRHMDWFDGFLVGIPEAFHSIGPDLTCGLMESIAVHPPEEAFQSDPDLTCLGVQLKSWVCGCSADYRQILLTWAYRGSGMLSLLCSSLIIYDVFKRNKKRSVTIYHQLVLGISFFDCLSSFAYMMVGVMYPREGGFYVSLGNYGTCTAQAFMIQLGQTSVFYNLCLSVYFFLVVCQNWKEDDFRKYRWVLHAAVCALGLGLAVAALPHTGPQLGVCGLLQPPAATSFRYVTLYYTLPISIVLVTLTSMTVAICVKVYMRQRKSQKWAMSKNMRLTKRVFWQSFWYVMAFYVTLPFLLVTYYIKFETPDSYWIFFVAGLLAPAQGFMNALVYFQRAGRKYCCFPKDGSSSFHDMMQRNVNFRRGTITEWMENGFYKKRKQRQNAVNAPPNVQQEVPAAATALPPDMEARDWMASDNDDEGETATSSRVRFVDDDTKPPPPPPPPPPSPRSPGFLVAFLNRRAQERRGSISSFSSIEFTQTSDASTGDIFSAVVEYWRLNEDDDDDDDDNNNNPAKLQEFNNAIRELQQDAQISDTSRVERNVGVLFGQPTTS